MACPSQGGTTLGGAVVLHGEVVSRFARPAGFVGLDGSDPGQQEGAGAWPA